MSNENNIFDWTAMSKELDTVTIHESNVGGIYRQVERLYLANEYRVGELSNMFYNQLSQYNTGAMMDTITVDTMYELAYKHWDMQMLIMYKEVKILVHQNELLDSILHQNKPSLLMGDSDDDNNF